MKFTDGIQQYVSRKHLRGYKFEHGQSYLFELCRRTGDIELENVTAQQVSDYLNSKALSVATWRLKYQVLLCFFDFWFSSGVTAELLMPPPKAPVRPSFTPYVFTRDQLHDLIRAVARDKSAQKLDPQTVRTFILLLYGTGATVGEAVGLTCRDVDLQARRLKLQWNRYSRARQIPIGADLQDALRKYLFWRARKHFQCEYLFVTMDGEQAPLYLFEKSFQRIRRIAGVARRDGTYFEPRLCDLRCTFAVHRITSWIKRGKDLNRLLPALAAYLGQVGLESTERYLHLTPERFRKELVKLSPVRIKKHWRDDRALMEFLASL